MKVADMLKNFENVDVKVNHKKHLIIQMYLVDCVAEGIIKKGSPQFNMLLAQSLISAKEGEKA